MPVFALLAGLAAATLAAGLLYQRIGLARDVRQCPPPGCLVPVDGFRMHVHVLGTHAPTVVFISGIAASCLNWTALQRRLATDVRTVAYDRPGLGWSDLGPRGLTAVDHVRHLRDALEGAKIQPPLVLVAHSFGAYIAELFVDAYPASVSGIVLIDPISWEEWSSPTQMQQRVLRAGAVAAYIGAALAAFGSVRLALARFRHGSEGIGRTMLASFGPRAVEAVSRIMGEVGKMPRDTWDAVQIHWSRPRAFIGMARHFLALPTSARAVREAEDARPALWPIPLLVLGAGNVTDRQQAAQRRLAARSTRGQYARVANAGHWIHLDQPDLVEAAILTLIREVQGA